jgi:hypothetical protein
MNQLWYQIVESYSALSLTRPASDRLIALTGIAKEFRDTMERTTAGPELATVSCGLESISGIWLRDLHRGLLWEQKFPESSRVRLIQFPTWSWASVICPVIWNNLYDARIKPKAKVVAIMTSEGEVFSIESLLPTLIPNQTFERSFDINNQFACLYMRGKVLQAMIREKMTAEGDLKLASEVSGCRNPVNCAWRSVCSSLSPTEISGCASFEHLEYQDDAAFGEGPLIYAFHISTTSRVPGGFGLGYITPWHEVFNVMFIRRAEGIKYERIGVGRLFGREIEAQLSAGPLQDVELI